MTARRAARRERYVNPRVIPAGAVIDGHLVPAELLNLEAEVWHDGPTYRRYMTEQAWGMPPKERMGLDAPSSRRRFSAVSGWARENGLVSGPYPDWKRIRDLFGLYGKDSES